MTAAIRNWGLLPVGFQRNSIAFYLLIIMVSIEACLSLAGLLGRPELRQWTYYYLALYPSQHAYGYISYALVHGGILHLIFNMIVFGQTGTICERKMGHMRFLIFTALGAIVAGWGGLYLTEFIRQQPISLVGFSGVVFAYIGVVFHGVISSSRNKMAAILDLLRRNVLLLLFIFVPFLFPGLGISGEAHLVGFVFGLLCAPLFLRQKSGTKAPPYS